MSAFKIVYYHFQFGCYSLGKMKKFIFDLILSTLPQYQYRCRWL